jgi:hypothetical protein
VRRRSPLVTAAFLGALLGAGLLLGRAEPAPAAPAAAVTRTSTSTTAAQTPSSVPVAGTGGSHGLTKLERAILFVTLTFVVGVPLLGPPDRGREPSSKRPALTLYDDPARVERASPPRHPEGEPPPLR